MGPSGRDRERWGSVPIGFDAGLLHAYSLRADIADTLMDRAEALAGRRPPVPPSH